MMVEDGTKTLALSKIKEFDTIFAEYAYETQNDKGVATLAISGEDVAMEFKSSGLFDSDLSDVSDESWLFKLSF